MDRCLMPIGYDLITHHFPYCEAYLGHIEMERANNKVSDSVLRSKTESAEALSYLQLLYDSTIKLPLK